MTVVKRHTFLTFLTSGLKALEPRASKGSENAESLKLLELPMQAVHWFEANMEVEGMDFQEEAEFLADRLLEEAAGAAGAMVAAMVQVWMK
jgi:hypothetical protein